MMKHKITNRIISLVIAVATLIGVVPMTSITVWADGLKKNDGKEYTIDEKPLTPSEIVEKEMASRNPITKDRVEDDLGFAVYVDGKFHAKGSFSEMWKLAMDLAPYAVDTTGNDNGDKAELVEFVLNMDIEYNKLWFVEQTMTVSNKKITIDLNGNVLRRVDGGSVIKVTDNAVLSNRRRRSLMRLKTYSAS